MSGRAVLPLFCLAPRGVCRAIWVTPKRGGLLLHHFNLTCAPLSWSHRRYPFCCTFRPGSSRFLSLTFMRRVALWCPDFPQPCLRNTATVQGAALTRCTRRHDFQTKNASRAAARRANGQPRARPRVGLLRLWPSMRRGGLPPLRGARPHGNRHSPCRQARYRTRRGIRRTRLRIYHKVRLRSDGGENRWRCGRSP